MIAGAVHPRIAEAASPFAGVGAPAEDPRRFVAAWRESVRRMGGTPAAERHDAVLCEGCDGQGWVITDDGRKALCSCDGWGVVREQEATCTTCGGVGYVRATDAGPGHPRFGEALPCRQCSSGQGRIIGAGVPPAYRDLTLDTYAVHCRMTDRRSDALSLALVLSEQGPTVFARANEGRTGLYLHGAAGRTKTGIAVAVLGALSRRAPRRTMAFVAWPYLLSEIRRTYQSGSVLTDDQVIDRYAYTAALVLDDLSPRGALDDQQNAWRVDVLWRLLERRIRHRDLVTIVTSTLSLEELERSWDEQIVSRLRRLCVPVELDGRDERGRLEQAA